MKAFKSGIIGLMMLAGTCASALAGQEPRLGGHDGGGGSATESSSQEVRAAVEWAIDSVLNRNNPEARGPNWFPFALHHAKGPKNPKDAGQPLLSCMLMGIPCDLEEFSQALDNDENIYVGMASVLELSKVEFLEDRPCPASDKANAAASVSAYQPGANICFSVSELRKTPYASLKAQVVSLLMHEVAHLYGFDERIAQEVQVAVYNSYSELFDKQLFANTYRLTWPLSSLKAGAFNIRNVSSDTKGNVENGKYGLGEMVGTIKVLQLSLPDGNLDRSLPHGRYELKDEVMASLEKLKTRIGNLAWNTASLTDAQFDQELVFIEKEIDATLELMERFVGEKQ